MLHALRYLVGDECFFQILRLMLYPTPDSETVKTGKQRRGVDSEEFIALSERISCQPLRWFFDVYLRQADPPLLRCGVREGDLELRWITESPEAFPMPIDVRIGNDTRRVAMPEGAARIKVGGMQYSIDPLNWVYKDVETPSGVLQAAREPVTPGLGPAYPNPFNASTTCSFSLRAAQHVTVDILNVSGRRVERLVDESMDAGTHQVTWQAGGRATGTYLIRFQTGDMRQTQRIALVK